MSSIVANLRNDVHCLKSMWFASKKHCETHAERLDQFYKPQASEYDRFRDKFLWGRRPMLAAVAARLQKQKDAVWIDLGGGTGENVLMMAEYTDLSRFKAIYVVDLCASLCAVARQKLSGPRFKNVHVIEADACTFSPEKLHVPADLITYSYSLSMIPNFHETVDKALSYLADAGLIGVADFFVSAKWDLPLRQMPWARRFFWRCTFDIDGIDLGPERRAYLEHHAERVWECNSQGSIPWVPYFRAPFYVWLGRKPTSGHAPHEAKAEAPALFPPTFLYSQSWEDPEPDAKVLALNSTDTVLTLTSGGCNSLTLALHGAKKVVSVDCNPAQSALLELKKLAIERLPYEDVWQLFGEGVHPRFHRLLLTELGPWMSEKSSRFWLQREHYFSQGLYWQGGMGKLCHAAHLLCMVTGLLPTKAALATANSLAEQKAVWERLWLIRFLKHGPSLLVHLFVWLASLLFLNRFVLWYGGGVPSKQFELIVKDKVHIAEYIARTFDGVAQHSHLRKSNYFYYNCLMGRFTRDNCPAYLHPASVKALKAGGTARLDVRTGTFLDALRSERFTKVILMDHVDWLDTAEVAELAAALRDNVAPGGKAVRDAGFDVRRQAVASDGYMDRVNMYSSFYLAKRLPDA